MEETIKLINNAINAELRLRDIAEDLRAKSWGMGHETSEYKAYANMRAMAHGAHVVIRDMGVQVCGWDGEVFGFWFNGDWYDYYEEGIDED